MRVRAIHGERHIPKTAQDWGAFRALSARNNYSGLEGLAHWLNDPSGLGRASRQVFLPIFTAPSSLEAIRRFNQLAAARRFRLAVTTLRQEGKIVAMPEIAGASDNTARAIQMIWQWYFSSRHRTRLKRCGQCSTFFVDNARPNNTQRCSQLCTWRWWNRERSVAKTRSRRKG